MVERREERTEQQISVREVTNIQVSWSEAERVNCSNAVKPSGKSIHSMLDLVQ